MLIRVACPCGHIGLINAETLPRDLACSHCGASRRIERKDGARRRRATMMARRGFDLPVFSTPLRVNLAPGGVNRGLFRHRRRAGEARIQMTGRLRMMLSAAGRIDLGV